ncbi:MAG: universal stress protein [Candidatus Binatia bacterium]
MFSRLLIPLDGSKTAEQVLPWARILAEGFSVPAVDLLTVVDIGSLLTSVDNARRFDDLVEQLSREGKEYLQRISGYFGGRKLMRSIEQGDPAELIVGKAEADRSTLIAMTTHGHSGLNRWLLGSVAEKVLRATTNPLLLVRANHEGKADGKASFKSIVVPLDGSELAETALSVVVRIAKKLRLEVFLIRVYSNPYSGFIGGGGHYAVNVDELTKGIRDQARNYLEAKMADLRKLGIEQISYLLQEGIAADEIVSVADQTPESLIVICSHGRSGVKRWALGSVAETVVRHLSRPVLVLRSV